MLGFRYIKSSPSTYLIHFRDGRVHREGAGISLLYFSPRSSLVSIPLATQDAPFVFREISADFQEVTVQGQASFRVTDPKALAERMDFTLAPDGKSHASDDPQKLSSRLVNAAQVQVRSLVQTRQLSDLLRDAAEIEGRVRDGLQQSKMLESFGVSLIDLAILAIRPTPETSRALEAEVREQILRQADDATYARRNSAIEQERRIRENELNTELAVEAKKRQIREAQMDAERAVLEKQQQITRQTIEGQIELEQRNRELVATKSDNARREAEDRAFAAKAMIDAYAGADPKVLQSLVVAQADPAALIAQAFQGIADSANRIGELNVSSELLQTLSKPARRG